MYDTDDATGAAPHVGRLRARLVRYRTGAMVLVAITCLIYFAAIRARHDRKTSVRQKPLDPRPVVRASYLVRSDDDERFQRHLRELFRPSHTMPSVPYMLHVLHLWGHAGKNRLGESDRREWIGGDAMIRALLDDEPFSWRGWSGATLFRSLDGTLRVAYTGATDLQGEAHFDQVLAAVAEAGVPANRRVGCVEGGAATVQDVVLSSLKNFTAGQAEIEWSLLAYLRYLPPRRQWINRWGESFTFDQMITQLVRRPYGSGPCFGTHALFVLALAVRVDARHSVLSDDVHRAAENYLKSASQLLERSVSADGFWSASWPQSAVDEVTAAGPSHAERIQATGHHLEWILLAPAEFRPADSVVRHALIWCRQQLMRASCRDIEESICAYSHAAKAMCLVTGGIDAER